MLIDQETILRLIRDAASEGIVDSIPLSEYLGKHLGGGQISRDWERIMDAREACSDRRSMAVAVYNEEEGELWEELITLQNSCPHDTVIPKSRFSSTHCLACKKDITE